MQAEVVVLANSKEEALDLLRKEDKWNIEELKRIEPKTVTLDKPCVVSKLIYFG
jgi:hypothetical protein